MAKRKIRVEPLSSTMKQAEIASKLEQLPLPCYGEINCECGRRMCPFQEQLKNQDINENI